MTGLIGNVSIPVYSGSNVGWAGEVAAATDGAGKFSEVNLEPKRLTAYILMFQNSSLFRIPTVQKKC